MAMIYYDSCDQYDGMPGWMLADADGDINLDGISVEEASSEAAKMLGISADEIEIR